MLEQFITFTFSKINTSLNKSGVEKKKLIGLPEWKNITIDNYLEYNNKSHHATAIITGKISGVTVLDYDTNDLYDAHLKLFQELTNNYTVKTKNGYHIYFKYTDKLQTTTDVNDIKHLDIRNNQAIVICNPTKYQILDGTTVEYKYIGGEILEIPEGLLKLLCGDNNTIIDKSIENSIGKKSKKCSKLSKLMSNTTDIDDEPIEPMEDPSVSEEDAPHFSSGEDPIVKHLGEIVKHKKTKLLPNLQKQLSEASSDNTKDVELLTKIINSGIISKLSVKRDNWRNACYALKNISPTKIGLSLFHTFSRGCPDSYNREEVDLFWNNLEISSNAEQFNINSVQSWAKKSNSAEYTKILETVYPKVKKQTTADKHKQKQDAIVSAKEERTTAGKSREDNGETVTLPSGKVIPFNQKYEDGVATDRDAGLLFLELYPNIVFCKNSLYIFNYRTGLYDTSDALLKQLIGEHSEYLFKIKTDRDGIDYITNESYGNTSFLMNNLIKLLPSFVIDDSWLREKSNSSLGYILFLDGYYDFISGTFVREFNPNIVFFNRVNSVFPVLTDEDKIYSEDIKNRLFYNALNVDEGNDLILNISRGLSGEILKRLVFVVGNSNSGKGVITSALGYAFGELVGNFNAEVLSVSKNSADEASKQRWALLSRFCRIIIANELNVLVPLNGNIIKKFSSGGDELTARTHNKEEEHFVPHFLPIILCNDVPEISPHDDGVMTRVKTLRFQREYVDNPTNKYELLADPNIKQEIKTERFRKCLVYIFLEAHRLFVIGGRIEPNYSSIDVDNEHIENSDRNSINQFKNAFEITNNVDDFILSTDLDTWVKSSGLQKSKVKFLKELNRHCDLSGFSNVIQRNHRLNKKQTRVWIGIKPIGVDV